MLEYYPIKTLPALSLEQTPELSPEEAAALALFQEKLDQKENFFDGPVLHVQDYRKDHIRLFPATYAWTLAQDFLPTLGPLSVSLLLKKSDQKFLWQKRSETVRMGGLWDFAASGSVSSLHIEMEIHREALEEVGQSILVDLQPAALCVFPSAKTERVFHSNWSEEDIKINEEVQEIAWDSRPPGQMVPANALIFNSYRQKTINF